MSVSQRAGTSARLLCATGPDATGTLRYRFHDLVRLYAREQAVEREGEGTLAAATTRALGAWLALAETADRLLLAGSGVTLHSGAPRWRCDPESVEHLLDSPTAWCSSERVNLLAGVQAERGELSELRARRGDLDAARSGLRVALRSARELGLRYDQARALRALGTIHASDGNLDDATCCLNESIALWRRVGIPHELAATHAALGSLHAGGNPAAAPDH